MESHREVRWWQHTDRHLCKQEPVEAAGLPEMQRKQLESRNCEKGEQPWQKY